MTNSVELYQGDCLIEMNKIADKSIDMILADLLLISRIINSIN